MTGNAFKSTIFKIAATVAAVAAVVGIFFGVFSERGGDPSFVTSYKWALDVIDDHYFGSFNVDLAQEDSMRGLVSQLDQYSEYYTAEEYKKILSENSGEKSGIIGVTSRYWKEGGGQLIITVQENSPAFYAGLVAGDVIVRGDDCNGHEKVFAGESDFANFIALFRDGENFNLYTKDEPSVKKTLAKSDYTAAYAFMATNDTAWQFVRTGDSDGEALVENPDRALNKVLNIGSGEDALPDGAAYLRLSQFYGSAAEETETLLRKFKAEGCTSLILDLRNNGGGYVEVMQKIAALFSSNDGLAMKSIDKHGDTKRYYCLSSSSFYINKDDVDVYVMANTGTASASEALAGFLISYNVVTYENVFISHYSDDYLEWAGSKKNDRTYGKGIMQQTFVNHATGEALKLTTARITWPNGRCIHDTGINAEEDACTLVNADWVVTKDDGELKSVCDIIKQRTQN